MGPKAPIDRFHTIFRRTVLSKDKTDALHFGHAGIDMIVVGANSSYCAPTTGDKQRWTHFLSN
jgi:hypothetical protein